MTVPVGTMGVAAGARGTERIGTVEKNPEKSMRWKNTRMKRTIEDGKYKVTEAIRVCSYTRGELKLAEGTVFEVRYGTAYFGEDCVPISLLIPAKGHFVRIGDCVYCKR